MVAPTLNNLTFQYTDTGILLNGPDNVFPLVDVTNVKGLDSATFRTSTKDTEGQDGSTVEADFESIRTIVLEGTVIAASSDALEPFLDSLKENFSTTSTYLPFYFKAPGVAQRVAYCKCISGFRYDWNMLRRTASAAFQVVLQAGDPIIYGTVQNLSSTTLITGVVSGFSFSFSFPFSFGASVVTPGTFSAMNNGNRPAPFTATVLGTAVNPGLQHVTLNRTVRLGVTVAAGGTLVIDFAKRTAYLDGSNVSGKITSEGWFLLQKGTNQLRFLADNASASITVASYDAWR